MFPRRLNAGEILQRGAQALPAKGQRGKGREGVKLCTLQSDFGPYRTASAVLSQRALGPRARDEPNMSAWAQGGFEDWRREREAIEAAGQVVDESGELDALTKERGLVDRAADIAALAIAQELMAVRRMEDGQEKRRAVAESKLSQRTSGQDRAADRFQHAQPEPASSQSSAFAAR